jgi:hypothetical protein
MATDPPLQTILSGPGAAVGGGFTVNIFVVVTVPHSLVTERVMV